MIELLFVALFQAAAGDPAASQAPATEAPAATATPAETGAPAQPPAPPAHQYCRREQVTGTRLTRRVCRSSADLSFQSQDTHDALHTLQRPVGTNSN